MMILLFTATWLNTIKNFTGSFLFFITTEIRRKSISFFEDTVDIEIEESLKLYM